MSDFAPAVGPRTMILPVLNGMRYMDALEQRFGKETLLEGVCLVATQLDADGRIIQLADFQSLTYGELDGKQTPRLETVDQAFRGAGFDASVSSLFFRTCGKNGCNSPAGVPSLVCFGNTGEIVAVPDGAELSLAALRECGAIAVACGYPPPAVFLEEKKSQITAVGSSLTSSMYRDLMRNTPVEVDTILGDLLDRGHKHGVSAPVLQAAFVNLSIYQRARNMERSDIASPLTQSARQQ